MHLGNSPLHYIAEVFVVDIKVLPAHRTLCPFFEFVLTVTKKKNRSGPILADSGRRGGEGLTILSTHLSPGSP
jgi:hypothetical protein